MWIGKLVAGSIGYAVGNFFGAAIGLLVGHFFDKGLAQLGQGLTPEKRAEIEKLFFSTVFTLLGKLAKADGRVSEDEIQHAQAIMEQLQLTPEHRKEAINLFKVGAEPEYDPTALLVSFRDATLFAPQLKQTLLIYLIGMAMADGTIDSAESTVLRNCAETLGIPVRILEHLIAMAKGQSEFRNGGEGRGQSQKGGLDAAYAALGVEKSASDGEVKKAYRKLMSEYHPDKLIGQGVPEDMIKLATERSQEVQAAYDLIKRSRKS